MHGGAADAELTEAVEPLLALVRSRLQRKRDVGHDAAADGLERSLEDVDTFIKRIRRDSALLRALEPADQGVLSKLEAFERSAQVDGDGAVVRACRTLQELGQYGLRCLTSTPVVSTPASTAISGAAARPSSPQVLGRITLSIASICLVPFLLPSPFFHVPGVYAPVAARGGRGGAARARGLSLYYRL